MHGLNDLKATNIVTDKEVECPVQGCRVRVERQRGHFRADTKFQCPSHGIYISPSTFEYPKIDDNLLWTGPSDISLLTRIGAVKRESRMQRDNSEDAVSWNIFRFLDSHSLVGPMLSSLTKADASEAETIYWSYSSSNNGPWPHLLYARVAFGEAARYRHAVNRGSEPDIIVLTKETLFFIEAKVGASNRTTPSNPGKVEKPYMESEGRWWDKEFRDDFKTIAIREKRYELARFWLLGTWIARQLGVDFRLINLVLDGKEKSIEDEFRQFLRTGPERFQRMTWNDIHAYVMKQSSRSPERDILDSYFENKSMGYDSKSRLRPAFR